MHSSHAGAWLSTISGPLAEKFGGELTISRLGNAVCWGFGGQSAVIKLSEDGTLAATFIDAPRVDLVSGRPAAAAYRARPAYALNQNGCRRMVGDLVDFFSGVREPSFTFIDAYPR